MLKISGDETDVREAFRSGAQVDEIRKFADPEDVEAFIKVGYLTKK